MATGCLEFEADLSALLDGELLPEHAERVRAHTGGCERCRAQLARLARLDTLLAGAPAPAVPASLRARLAARLAAVPASEARSELQASGGEEACEARSEPQASEGEEACEARSEPQASGVENERGLGARASGPRVPRRAWRGRAAAALAAVAAGVSFYLAVASREPAPQRGEPSPVQVARPQAEPLPAVPQLAKRDTPAPESKNAAPVAPLAPRRERVATPPLDLESVPDADLELALELESVEDFDEIANLELLELMLEAEAT